jgi:hypothetical protein
MILASLESFWLYTEGNLNSVTGKRDMGVHIELSISN